MSRSEAILIVSRVVSFYLLCWVLADLTYLPTHVREVLFHLAPQTPTGAHYRDIYVLDLVFLLIRIAVFSVLAIWLYRCGPRIQAYFLPEVEGEADQ